MAKAPKGITHARPKSRDDKGDKDKKEVVQTPTQFGSHASMTDEERTGQIAEAKQDAGDPWVILLDERGRYATRKSKLDSGLADPNRQGDSTVRDQRVQELTAK